MEQNGLHYYGGNGSQSFEANGPAYLRADQPSSYPSGVTSPSVSQQWTGPSTYSMPFPPTSSLLYPPVSPPQTTVTNGSPPYYPPMGATYQPSTSWQTGRNESPSSFMYNTQSNAPGVMPWQHWQEDKPPSLQMSNPAVVGAQPWRDVRRGIVDEGFKTWLLGAYNFISFSSQQVVPNFFFPIVRLDLRPASVIIAPNQTIGLTR